MFRSAADRSMTRRTRDDRRNMCRQAGTRTGIDGASLYDRLTRHVPNLLADRLVAYPSRRPPRDYGPSQGPVSRVPSQPGLTQRNPFTVRDRSLEEPAPQVKTASLPFPEGDGRATIRMLNLVHLTAQTRTSSSTEATTRQPPPCTSSSSTARTGRSQPSSASSGAFPSPSSGCTSSRSCRACSTSTNRESSIGTSRGAISSPPRKGVSSVSPPWARGQMGSLGARPFSAGTHRRQGR